MMLVLITRDVKEKHGMFTRAVVEFAPRDSDGWVQMARKPMNGVGSYHYGLKGMDGSDKIYNMKADVFLDQAVVQAPGSGNAGVTTAIRSLELTKETLPTVRTEYPVWCFLLGTYKVGPTRASIALVLGRSLTNPDVFERVGLVEMDIG